VPVLVLEPNSPSLEREEEWDAAAGIASVKRLSRTTGAPLASRCEHSAAAFTPTTALRGEVAVPGVAICASLIVVRHVNVYVR
jgi:hypothetical protein